MNHSQRDLYIVTRDGAPRLGRRLGLGGGRGALPEAVLEAAGHRLEMAHAPSAVRAPAE